MSEGNEVTVQSATAQVERLAQTGGHKWLAVTHYAALSALATAMVKAGIAPRNISAEQALGIMAFGLELGLGPIMSLKTIAFVNGKACVYADGIRALLLASGKLADQPVETVTGEGDARTATCTMYRVGLKSPTTKTFSVKDAKTAGLWGKAGPWTQYPDRMLGWRALGFAARDGFADVLNGLWTREEAEDIPVDATVEDIRTAAPGSISMPEPQVSAKSTVSSGGNGDQPPSKGGTWTEEHKRLADAIMLCANGDQDRARSMCRSYSAFVDKKTGKHVDGVESVRDMRLARVRATWRRVEPEYNVALREAEDAAAQTRAGEPSAQSMSREEEEAAIEATRADGDGLPF